MPLRIHVEQDLCTGHGRCAAVSPDVFFLDESGYNAASSDYEIADGLEESARLGAANCPEGCIVVIRD